MFIAVVGVVVAVLRGDWLVARTAGLCHCLLRDCCLAATVITCIFVLLPFVILCFLYLDCQASRSHRSTVPVDQPGGDARHQGYLFREGP